MRRLLVVGVTVIGIALAVRAAAEDWPQFLGPERNGVYREPALADTWGPQGPRVVWRKSIGQGFSGPVVVGGRHPLHRIGNQKSSTRSTRAWRRPVAICLRLLLSGRFRV
jgi:hypothetical protein